MALNRELQQLIIMVKGQLERIFNIYSTIEEIAQEKHLELNSEMIRRYTGLILSNIIICAGDNAYLTIVNHLDTRFAQTRFTQPTTDIGIPGQSASVMTTIMSKFSEAIAKMRSGGKTSLQNFSVSSANLQVEGESEDAKEFKAGIDHATRNTIVNRAFRAFKQYGSPEETIRGITRDVLMLEVYFSIFEGEFDLLMREKNEEDNARLLTRVNDADKLEDIKEVMKTMLKPATWTKTESFKRFHSQLPKSNLNFNIAEQIQSTEYMSQDVKNSALKDIFNVVIKSNVGNQAPSTKILNELTNEFEQIRAAREAGEAGAWNAKGFAASQPTVLVGPQSKATAPVSWSAAAAAPISLSAAATALAAATAQSNQRRFERFNGGSRKKRIIRKTLRKHY
jgi:hypothetical protein